MEQGVENVRGILQNKDLLKMQQIVRWGQVQ